MDLYVGREGYVGMGWVCRDVGVCRGGRDMYVWRGI